MASAFLSSIQSTITQVRLFHILSASLSSSLDPSGTVWDALMVLEGTLERIQTVLHDAEEREIRDAAVKLWLEDLRLLAYEAEDVLDEYDYEKLRAQIEDGASHKRKRAEGHDDKGVSGSLSTTASIPYGIGDRIRKISERFDEVFLVGKQLRLRSEEKQRQRRASRAAYVARASPMVDEFRIYGREHDKHKLIDLLLSDEVGNGISVIPIVGKGGLGKTTIAQLVYNDLEVKEYFDLTGWVCASDDFNVTRLTKGIIESLTKEPCGGRTQLSTLQYTLEETVRGKRLLLVLDDVWNQQPNLWESLKIPFAGAETARIIVTCRNNAVAEIMQTVDPYHPGYLSPEESWSLFRHYAFGGGVSEGESSLVDIGKKIVMECSGLPLAVKTIGSLLRHMTDEASWMDVLKSDLWELDENNEILPSLRLSYSRMPAHLKRCFVYCSMFPKDYIFRKDVLVSLWMAQGYIMPQDGKRLEDIGNEYFDDLRRRSFFHSYSISDFYRFKMHDMMHDLAKYIAGNECCTIVDEKPCSFSNEVRHLYMEPQDNSVKSLSSYHPEALRTLLIVDQHECAELTKFLLLLPMMGCLRTLEFEWASEDELPNSIGNLKHLRLLHIRSKSVERLPESVCLLYHLQTLILDCDRLVELPNGLSKLINLRCLQVWKSHITRLPTSICELHKLQTLEIQYGHISSSYSTKKYPS